MLASLQLTTKLIESKEEIPLLSFKDERILIVTQICALQIEMEQKSNRCGKDILNEKLIWIGITINKRRYSQRN